MKLGDLRGVVEAVNEACTCGGGGHDNCCPACEVYHAIRDMEVDEPRPANSAEPLPPSPELSEALDWLGKLNRNSDDDGVANTALFLIEAIKNLRHCIASKDIVVYRAIDALQSVRLCRQCEPKWVDVMARFSSAKMVQP